MEHSVARNKLTCLIRKDLSTNYQLYLLVLPALIYIIIFNYIPMYGIQIAFRDFRPGRGIWGSEWVGFKYYLRFFNSYQAMRVVWNTVYLNILSLGLFPVPIVMALLLNQIQHPSYKKAIQTITYAPYFISTVVLVGMVNLFLSPNYGIINRIVVLLGGEAQLFMGSSRWFRTIYFTMGLYQNTGWGMILYLATLSKVDPELYEASVIDGSNRFHQILHIDIPVLVPIIIISLILKLGSMMSSLFERVYLMQNAMNTEVSEVLSTYTYKIGLINGDFSYSTAIGLFNTIVNFLLLVVMNYTSNHVTKIGLW